MAKQTNIPIVDEDFMKKVISQGLPLKRDDMYKNDKNSFNRSVKII
ncbi:MAG: hypothetical protein GZ091_07585 [Paludibacter sp.]|nr:hypothetical protein [Paludibacter sp.]